MALHPFLASLGFMEPADIDAVEKRFLEVVKEHLQRIATNYDEAAVKKEEAWLREIHTRFFQYTLQWVMDEARHNKAPPGPEALKLKKQAREIMNDLQRHMTEFSCCYMHLHRFMTLLRDEIRGEEVRLGVPAAKDIKWTSDAGTMLALRSPQGLTFSRSAQLQRDSEGRLVDGQGRALQATDGGDLVITSGSPAVMGDGTVLVDGQPQGRIGLFDPASVAAGRPEPFERGSIRQGLVVGSDVELGDEMMELNKASRMAETGAKLFQLYDDLLSKTAGQLGSISK